MAPDDDRPDFDPSQGNLDSTELSADLDDIELAYRQALQALDAAEQQMGSMLVEFAEASTNTQDELQTPSGLSIGAQLADELRETAAQTEASSQTVLVEGVRRVTPREVVEAALFVGGPVALTARRLATLIGQNVDNRVVVSLIDSINQSWARENRPYEIQLQEGGYRLELREEFADVSTRTFGLGPRDIKLSPETLEVLAFVAWNQPITTDSLKSINKPNAPSVLRQLLRLQLVEIQRTGNRRSDVSYVTTARFLKLFGLKSLADLPTADIFSFK